MLEGVFPPESGTRMETGKHRVLSFSLWLVVVVSPGTQADWPPVCSSGVWSHGYHAEITNTRVDTAVSSWTKRVKKKMKGRLCGWVYCRKGRTHGSKLAQAAKEQHKTQGEALGESLSLSQPEPSWLTVACCYYLMNPNDDQIFLL